MPKPVRVVGYIVGAMLLTVVLLEAGMVWGFLAVGWEAAQFILLAVALLLVLMTGLIWGLCRVICPAKACARAHIR